MLGVFVKVINKLIVMKIKVFKLQLMKLFSFLALIVLSCQQVFASDSDPFTSTGNKMYGILFGSLGISLCAISLGGTFVLAKFGKITWDKFLFIGFCIAGFIGTPSIISLIQSAVGNR